MKILTIAVPAYNSQDYLDRCIDSLLKGGPDVEILIVDDGSKDRTAAIADGYAAKYPDIVRVIHQENGGHGDAVTTGIHNATGLYFKVCDSDDHLAEAPFHQVVAFLKQSAAEEKHLDMLVCNFVYDKQGVPEWRKKVISYHKMFPVNTYFTWEEAKPARMGHYILMHSVIYRTAMLQEMNMRLPKHTFYVDNLYVYEPMEHVKTLYYMDTNLYRYYIGRADQSVNTEVMKKRIDQQDRVNRLMFSYRDLNQIENRRVADYMFKYLAMITTITTVFYDLIGTEEADRKRDKLWSDFHDQNFGMWKQLRYYKFGVGLHLGGKVWHHVFIPLFYRIGQFIFGYN